MRPVLRPPALWSAAVAIDATVWGGRPGPPPSAPRRAAWCRVWAVRVLQCGRWSRPAESTGTGSSPRHRLRPVEGGRAQTGQMAPTLQRWVTGQWQVLGLGLDAGRRVRGCLIWREGSEGDIWPAGTWEGSFVWLNGGTRVGYGLLCRPLTKSWSWLKAGVFIMTCAFDKGSLCHHYHVCKSKRDYCSGSWKWTTSENRRRLSVIANTLTLARSGHFS